MFRYAVPYPVPPGKSDAEVKEAAEYFRAHPVEYRESRRRAGVTFERIYLMKTPAGTFVIAYAEGEKSYGETVAGLLDPSIELNRYFADFLQRVHEFDPAQAASLPPPETIGDWVDPDVGVRGRGVAFTVPVIPGRDDLGRAFGKEAYTNRRDELTVSRRGFKQWVEVVTLMQTPMGSAISVYLEGDDPVASNRAFAASQSPFDRWFKDELKKLFPPEVDFDVPLPPIMEVFDSRALPIA